MRKKKEQTPEEILQEKISKIQREREWKWFWVECILLVAVVSLVFHFVLGIARVSGHSMEPSLSDGELLVFYRLDSEYQAGDLVIVHRDEGVEYVKRVVAVAGDVVELGADGTIVINGEAENRSFLQGKTRAVSGQVTFPYEVPEDCCFVLGDNRENSLDSRSFGAVRNEEILGRVFFHLGMTR